MTEATRVLVVEDEAAVRELIGLTLKRAGFEFAEAANAEEGRRAVLANPPDLVLLDWMLPDRSGFDLARELRDNSATREIPLILLSARRDEHDKVSALNAGADDYVTKPFSPAELIARIKAVLRRTAPERAASSVEVEGLRLDLETHRVTVNGAPLEPVPSRTEFRLLRFFMTNPERVHSRERIINAVWGLDADVVERTVDVHVLRLRKLLVASGHERHLQTVRGEGYRFARRP